jgi:hypothetical protein
MSARRHSAIDGREERVKFLALIYGEEGGWDALSDEERSRVYERYGAFAREGREAGVVVGGDELASTTTATTVRVRDGQTAVTDGPYAEVKEALGGYFILECASMDEALDWAARIPAVERGAVEVRPVHAGDEDAQAPAAEAAGVAS